MRVFQDPTTGTYIREDGMPGYGCARCGNGYATAETRDDTDAHGCEGLNRDMREFGPCKAMFSEGYTDEDIEALTVGLTSTQFVCVWEFRDNLGYGGDSEIIGRDIRPDGTFGPWKAMSTDFFSYLFNPDTDLTIDGVTAFLSDDLFETQNIEGLPVYTGTNAAYTDATA